MPVRTKAGIFYGSTTGNTERVAGLIAGRLGKWFLTGLHDIADAPASIMNSYDLLILGTSTWGLGKLQEDWEHWLTLPGISGIKDKAVAFFGLGDQDSYPETFADGLGILYNRFFTAPLAHIGKWNRGEYCFENSQAFHCDHFIGLVLDEENQPELTQERIDAWVDQLVKEYESIAGKG